MMNYAGAIRGQMKKVRGDQVKNYAGGYVFKISPFEQLKRFLILGAEGNTLYASRELIITDNVEAIDKALQIDPQKTVDIIANLSVRGEVIKNDTCLFALAYIGSHPDPAIRKIAFSRLKDVARTGSHILYFMSQLKTLGHIGRIAKKVTSDWYTQKDYRSLVYQTLKYKNRYSFTHRDILRIVHPSPKDDLQSRYFASILGKVSLADLPSPAKDIYKLTHAETEGEVVELLNSSNIGAWEFLPTQFLRSREVWKVLLKRNFVPYQALVRNLNRLSSIGMTQDMKEIVLRKLTDVEVIRKSRIHPVKILLARETYAMGRGVRGGMSWTVDRHILKALSEAFYKSVKNSKPVQGKILVGIDVSGSMTCGDLGGFTPGQIAMAMGQVLKHREGKNAIITAFSDYLVNIDEYFNDTSKTLYDLFDELSDRLSWGATDCALPILYATGPSSGYSLDIDIFVVITDNETWYGSIHPFEALKRYRKKMNKPRAKLIVYGLEASGFSIADPEDPYMLDVAGFTPSFMEVLEKFSRM